MEPVPVGVRVMAKFSDGAISVGYQTSGGAFFVVRLEGSPLALPSGEIVDWELCPIEDEMPRRRHDLTALLNAPSAAF